MTPADSFAARGLQLVVIACGVATLWHALHAHRRGEARPLFAWLSVLAYGVTMEILSYHAFDNFKHARFDVMLYGGRMPLYVVWLYPLFLYTAIQAIARLGLSRAVEPFAVGLAIVLLDVPFDILGAGEWWSWSATDPNLRARWLDVPVTSYYWHLAFGGCLAFWVRTLGAKKIRLWLAPLVGVLTIVMGVVCFIPFHVLKRIGAPDGAIVIGLAASAALLLLVARKRPVEAATDRLLLALPVAYHAFLLLVLARAWPRLAAPGATAAAVIAATVLSLAVQARAQFVRGPRAAEAIAAGGAS